MKSRLLVAVDILRRISGSRSTTATACLRTIMSKSRLDRMSSHIASALSNGSVEAVSVDAEPYKFKEITIPVPWGHIAAKEWGNPGSGARRVLGVHGWQDNCGTFDPLVPLLLPDVNLHFVSVDLPGHGLSSHRPVGSFYHMFDYVADLKRVVRHLQWESNFSFISHSMGSAIALAYSACFSDEVDRLVLFDSVVPLTRNAKHLPLRMAASVQKLIECERVSGPRSVDIEYAIKLIVDSMDGSVSERGARVLLERGSRPAKDDQKKILFTRDQRLKVESLPGVTREQSLALAKGIRSDMLIISASEGLVRNGHQIEEEVEEYVQTFRHNCRSFRMVDVDGTHHVHLNNPERVAKYVREFLAN